MLFVAAYVVLSPRAEAVWSITQPPNNGRYFSDRYIHSEGFRDMGKQANVDLYDGNGSVGSVFLNAAPMQTTWSYDWQPPGGGNFGVGLGACELWDPSVSPPAHKQTTTFDIVNFP